MTRTLISIETIKRLGLEPGDYDLVAYIGNGWFMVDLRLDILLKHL